MEVLELQLLAVNWKEGWFMVEENSYIFLIQPEYDKFENKKLSSEKELIELVCTPAAEDLRSLDLRFFSYSSLVEFVEERMEEIFYQDSCGDMDQDELQTFIKELPLEAIELFVQDLEQEIKNRCYNDHQFDFALSLAQAPVLQNDPSLRSRVSVVIEQLKLQKLAPAQGRGGHQQLSLSEMQAVGCNQSDSVPEVHQASCSLLSSL